MTKTIYLIVACCFLISLGYASAPCSARGAGALTPPGAPGNLVYAESDVNTFMRSESLGSECLNILVLLDLSDRIDAEKHPGQAQRDVAAIGEAWNLFQMVLKQKRYRRSCDQLRIDVAPQQDSPDVTRFLDSLSVSDRQSMVPVQRRKALEAKHATFMQALEALYETASNTDSYAGADIWRYVKDELEMYPQDSRGRTVRNIVIVLTDGYQYSASKHRVRNRFTYNVGAAMQPFRNNEDWQNHFDNQDYGFIHAAKDMSHVEVLIMGVTPRPEALNELDIIKKYWEKWFSEMGVMHIEIYSASASLETERERVRRFFQNH